MEKPAILQVGPYPQWDQESLDAAFRVHRYFESADKAALLAEVGPTIRAIATRGELGARKAMGQLVRDNLTAHFAGQPLPTPVL
jgi:lactate dehydrogenase-like 2-hydroxyacid dehydrogenase